MPIVYRSEKGAPLANNEVDGNFRDLDQRATANQQAAGDAQQAAEDAQGAADAAGSAAVAVGQALDTHKASGDHDTRYLRRDVPDAAPLLSGIPEGGIVGLPGDLDVLRTAVQRLQYGDGPYPSLDLQFKGAQKLDPRITFERPTEASYTDAFRRTVIAGVNQPRFDYDPMTGKPLGLLLEDLAVNRALWSETLTNSYWSVSRSAIQDDGVRLAPNGGKFFKHVADDQNATHTLYQPVSYTAGRRVTLSGVFHPAEISKVRISAAASTTPLGGVNPRGHFDLIAGTATAGDGATVGMVPQKDGSWRCWVGFIPTVTIATQSYVWLLDASESTNFAGDNVGGLYETMRQVEDGAMSSYIKTTNGAMSRAADLPTLPLGEWFNPEEGTFVIEADTLNDDSTSPSRRVFCLTDGTNVNRIDVYLATSNRINLFTIDGTGATGSVTAAGIITPGVPFKFLFDYDYSSGDYSCSTNGGPSASIPAGPKPVLDRSILGRSVVSGSLGGHFQRLRYFPRRLSATEQQEVLTA